MCILFNFYIILINFNKAINMKTFYIFFISLLLFLNTYSQNQEFESKGDSSSNMYSPSQSMNENNIKSPLSNKIHLSFQTGISFYSCGNQSAFDKWIAPAVTYNLTPKFHFTVGTMAVFSKPDYLQYSFNNEGVKTVSQNTNTGQYFLFAKGEYLLNSNITLRGTIMKEVPNNQINPNASSLSSVGIDFKISDGFSISADCRVSKGYNASLMHNINESNFSAFPTNGGFFNRTR